MMREYKVTVVLLHIFLLCFGASANFNFVLSNERRKINVVECKNGSSDAAKLTETLFFVDCTIKDCVGVNLCPPPATTYYRFLHSIGADVASMEHLFLYGVQPKPVLTGQHLAGLPLMQLRVYYDENLRTYPSPSADYLDSLTKLRFIIFKYGKFPPLPKHSVVEEASFDQGASSGAFGGCTELRSVNLKLWEVYEDRWLAECPQLTILRLKQMSGIEVQRTIRGASRLKHLSVNYCQFKDPTFLNSFDLPERFFDDLGNLVTLDLDNNDIAALPYINITMPYLEELSLKFNKIGAIGMENKGGSDAVIKILNAAPRLRTLDVSNNAAFDVCHAYYFRGKGFNGANTMQKLTIEHPTLRSLILDNTASRVDCITREGLPALEHLDMAGNKLTLVFFEHLQISKQPLRVSFYDSPISSVFLNKPQYEDLHNRSQSNKLNLKIVGLTALDCDCKNPYFIKAIQEGLIDGEFITCKGDEEKYLELRKKGLSIKATQETILRQMNMSKLECDKYPCSGCVCRRYFRNHYLVVDCTGTGIRTVPRFPKNILKRLDASHNHIEKLTPEDIPRPLVYADLSSNHIAHVDKETTRELFISRERHLRLFRNPIACDCENYYFLKTLQERFSQVDDYGNLTCRTEKTVLHVSDVDVDRLCPKVTVLTASLAVSGVFLICALAATFIHYRYGRAVRIFVHARGWFAWCVKEDSIDKDREYDAFISFCHTDTELVTDVLVPKLEAMGYRICVHYRDWTLGELIPTNIVRSVESSRRTVLLISRSFLTSMWGLLEFRISHARALHDGVQRIIVVLLEDVQEDDVDTDLRSYLRSNTYVRWDDPWFWDKIRYALPRPRPPRKTTKTVDICLSDSTTNIICSESNIDDGNLDSDNNIINVVK